MCNYFPGEAERSMRSNRQMPIASICDLMDDIVEGHEQTIEQLTSCIR